MERHPPAVHDGHEAVLPERGPRGRAVRVSGPPAQRLPVVLPRRDRDGLEDRGQARSVDRVEGRGVVRHRGELGADGVHLGCPTLRGAGERGQGGALVDARRWARRPIAGSREEEGEEGRGAEEGEGGGRCADLAALQANLVMLLSLC